MNLSNAKIRRVQPKEIPELVRMVQTATTHPWTEPVFRDCLKAHYHIWVLSKSGNIVAFVVALDQVNELQILNICVSPECQRQGYGHQLLRHAIQYAQLNHSGSIILEVRASNRVAISLYHSVGFVDVGLRRGYYPSKHDREDALLMRLLLPS